MKNAKIAEVEFDYANNPNDWTLSWEHATFSHRTECEFIFYIGDIDSLLDLKIKGFSESFLNECKYAKSKGFRYLILLS